VREPSTKQEAEALALIAAGKVRVISAGPGCCSALVRGTSLYVVTLDADGWTCTCPLTDYRPGWTCKHVAAVQFVCDGRSEQGEIDDGIRPEGASDGHQG